MQLRPIPLHLPLLTLVLTCMELLGGSTRGQSQLFDLLGVGSLTAGIERHLPWLHFLPSCPSLPPHLPRPPEKLVARK